MKKLQEFSADRGMGWKFTTSAQGPFKETNNPCKHVEFMQKVVDSFGVARHVMFSPSLFPPKKGNITTRNVKVDNIVMVADDNTVCEKWTIG